MKRLLPLLLLLASCDDDGREHTLADAQLGAPPEAYWVRDVEADPPEWLSEVGLFSDLASRTPYAGWIDYAPPHPLWSNGAAKERLLFLPPGTSVEPGDVAYSWPVGTVLVKTFTYEGLDGRAGARAVETRLLFQRADGWDLAMYLWNSEGTEARLQAGNWPGRVVELAGPDGAFAYTLPGKLDCRACHDTNAGGPVIGFAPHNADPERVGEFLLVHNRSDGRTPEETAAMSWIVGNCGHCHHGMGGGDNAAYSLLPLELVANTVGRDTEGSASAVGVRVVPGDPEASILFEASFAAHRPGYAGEAKPMPPVGVDVPDPEGERVLRAWIEGLAP